jgi:hypothetical protein
MCSSYDEPLEVRRLKNKAADFSGEKSQHAIGVALFRGLGKLESI